MNSQREGLGLDCGIVFFADVLIKYSPKILKLYL